MAMVSIFESIPYRNGFKIHRWLHLVGSSPTLGTKHSLSSRLDLSIRYRLVVLEPVRKVFRRHGFGKKVSLYLVASFLLQVLYYVLILDTFGDDLKPESMGHFDDEADDMDIRFVVLQAPDKGLIDLQFIRRYVPEVGQTGVAGTKIIYGYLYTVLPQ